MIQKEILLKNINNDIDKALDYGECRIANNLELASTIIQDLAEEKLEEYLNKRKKW